MSVLLNRQRTISSVSNRNGDKPGAGSHSNPITNTEAKRFTNASCDSNTFTGSYSYSNSKRESYAKRDPNSITCCKNAGSKAESNNHLCTYS